MSAPAHHGTDLLIGTSLDAAALCDVLAATLPVRREDIFLTEVVGTWSDACLAAFGSRNVVQVHALLQPANLTFKADLEFTHPIPIRALQALADTGGCTVALDRQIVFPDEIGCPSGEGYVIFQPGQPPRSGALRERGEDDDLVFDWVPTDDPLPPLPDDSRS